MTANVTLVEVHQTPALAVMTVVAVGLVVATTVDFLPGVVLVASAMLLGAALRLALPARQAGWLVVRNRSLDATVLLALGGGLLVLAASVPRP